MTEQNPPSDVPAGDRTPTRRRHRARRPRTDEPPADQDHPEQPPAAADDAATEPPTPELPILAAPADPVPPVVDTDEALAGTVAALAGGRGPIAIDAERAQSYRYSAKAYLIQIRREGSGTHLIDPIAFAPEGGLADLSAVAEAMSGDDWIIHAATQDTPCLAEVQMVPQTLFDTELAGRLLNYPRVGLSTLIEEFFGLRLLKEHSAADWSSRPLPEDWLVYAALDVELLVELREKLLVELREAGKLEWAIEEFAWLAERAAAPPVPRQDPWRRTSGIHAVRSPRGLAIVRELWSSRDELARRLDKAPSKILADKAISELAAKATPSKQAMRSIPGFERRMARRYQVNWVQALERAEALPKQKLPPVHLPTDAPPPPRNWQNKFPEAYQRFVTMREAMASLAEQHQLPAENLLTPDFWRRLAWQPPEAADEDSVDAFLAALGARSWQRRLTVPTLLGVLTG